MRIIVNKKDMELIFSGFGLFDLFVDLMYKLKRVFGEDVELEMEIESEDN